MRRIPHDEAAKVADQIGTLGRVVLDELEHTKPMVAHTILDAVEQIIRAGDELSQHLHATIAAEG